MQPADEQTPSTPPLPRRLLGWLRFPVLASLLGSRAFCVSLVVLIGVQVFFSAMGWHLIRCAMLEFTGVPCPGCGLTRSAVATARWDLPAVLEYNVFGPLALLAMALFSVAAVLPDRLRARLITAVSAIEKTSGLTNFCFLALWVYWLSRITILGRDFGVHLAP